MKNLLIPAPFVLAALALGGCAGTTGLTTTEPDGVYYSSQDRTTAVASAAPAANPDGGNAASTPVPDDANPDYRGGNSAASARPNSPSYYDDGYSNSSRFRQPYTGPSVSYYTPSWAATPTFYNDPFYGSYGWGGGCCGFSPYSSAFYDPFWGPSFYSPWGGGFGSGWSVSIGYGWGRPWGGWGGGYYGYGRPYGYGGGFYDPFYYSGYPFYSGYYGYGGGYYGPRYVYSNYNNTAGGDRGGNTVRVGHRTDRSVDAVGGRGSAGPVNSGGVVVAPNTPAGGGRPRLEGRGAPVAPTGGGLVSAPINEAGGRPRFNDVGGSNTGAPANENVTVRPERVKLDQPQPAQYGSYNQPTRIDGGNDALPQPAGNGGGRPRWRDAAPAGNEAYGQPAGAPQPAAVPAPSEQRGGRRGGFFQDIFSAPAPSNNGGNADQYGGGRRNSGFDRPSRSFDQPQPSRSFERPTFSEPSFGGSRGGGGGFGGGNGGGGGGGGRRGRMQ